MALSIIIFSTYNVEGTPIWYNLLMVFISMRAIIFVTVWIKIKSGSLWTAAILHTSHNMFSQLVFDVIAINYGITKYITTEFGFGLAFVYAMIGIYCLTKNRNQVLNKVKINNINNL